MNAHPRPFYYLENFERALDWLRERYASLLTDEEHEFIVMFAGVPLASRALLVRMIMRRGALFRLSGLAYSEIGSVADALAPLAAIGWLDLSPTLDANEVCALLTQRELAGLLGYRGLRKSESLEALHRFRDGACPLEEWWLYAPDSVVRVLVAPLCERLRLMFFGSFQQGWAEFVLADLGIFRYETVELEPGSRAFQTREEIEQFHALYRARELEQAEAPAEQVLAAIPAALAGCSWIESRRAKLLFAVGQRFEKAGDPQRALDVYRDCRLPDARIREQRIGRRLGLDTTPRARRVIDYDVISLELQQSYRSVEWATLQHLSGDGSAVWHVENALLTSMFGLLCWRAIFAPLPGAFFHPFHAAPADLFEHDFVARRSDMFAKCLAELDDGRHRETILATFAAKVGIQMPFVAWGRITREMLDLALDCIPAPHLRLFFDRLLGDLGAHRTGLPDLIQFWPAERRYRLIEVKGPGDRLQDHQLGWLRFCAAHGLPACVCKVTWLSAVA